MSTARHQQTDGGAEVSVRIEKTTLKKMVNHHQDDWTMFLREIQFAFNNSINSMTGFTPFYLAYGVSPLTFPNFANSDSTLLLKFKTYQKDVQRAHEVLNKQQQRMMQEYDKRHTSPPLYEIGDLVLLDHEGINWIPEKNVSAKLLQLFIGPFEVLKVDSAYENITLELPPTMKCHNTFHVSKLRPWFPADEFFPDREIPEEPLPEVDENGEENYEVDHIVDTRVYGQWKKHQFLVHWKGYDCSHDTWEPLDNLDSAKEALIEYLAQRPIPGFSLEAALGS